MGTWKSLVGQRFGNWVVVSEIDAIRSLCRCDCGTIKPVTRTSLKQGTSKSCGCLSKEYAQKRRKFCKYDLTNDYGVGYTHKGDKFYFDLEDFDKIKNYSWSCNKEGYLMTSIEGKTYRMHRIIMNCSDSKIWIDHINHDVKDNRKSNLRIVNNMQNQMNAKLRSNNVSKCTGVHYHKDDNKWIATIQIDKKKVHLGAYEDYEDAVNARKQAENRYFMQYSYDNSIQISERII
jgi:hypothetical protein